MLVASRRPRLSSKSPQNSCARIQIKSIRVITRFVVRALGRGKRQACKNAEQIPFTSAESKLRNVGKGLKEAYLQVEGEGGV